MSGRLGYGRLGYFRLGSGDDEAGFSFAVLAVVRSSASGSWAFDACTSLTAPKSFSAYAVIRGQVTGSFTAGAAVPSQTPARASQVVAETIISGDGSARASQVVAEAVATGDPTSRVSHVVLEVMWRSAVQTATIDATISKGRTGSFSADAFYLYRHESSFAANAVAMPRFSADAVVAQFTGYAFPLDAHIVRRIQSGLSLDAVIRPRLTAQAVIKGSRSDYYIFSAVRRETFSGSFVAAGWKCPAFHVDAAVFGALTGSFVLRSVTRVHRSGSFSADASISSRLYARSIIRKQFTSGWVTDAVVASRRLSVDAAIWRQVAASFDLNSIFKAPPVVATIKADAYINAGNSWSMRALIVSVGSGSISMDAIVGLPRMKADAVVLREMREDNTQPVWEHDNVLVVTGNVETILPDCRIDVIVGSGIRPSSVTLNWTIWVSQNKHNLYEEIVLQARLRLRRSGVTGQVLWEYVWDVQSGNWVDGHQQVSIGSYVDPSPTDGIYVLTVQEVVYNSVLHQYDPGSIYPEIWSNTREFAASPQAPRLDAVIDGWQGYHVSQTPLEVLFERLEVETRATQHAVEALYSRSEIPTRLTQHAVEVAVGRPAVVATAAMSQTAVEVLVPALRTRFQSWAVILRTFAHSVRHGAVILREQHSSFVLDAFIAPRHTFSDATVGVVALGSPDTLGVPYLYRGLIGFGLRTDPFASYVVAWHGGTVEVHGYADHWTAFVANSEGRRLVWKDFWPSGQEWWNVRFAVDSGHATSTRVRVWLDTETDWQAIGPVDDRPPMERAYLSTDGEFGWLSILTEDAPWRFDGAFSLSVLVGAPTGGYFRMDAGIFARPTGFIPARASVLAAHVSTFHVDALVMRAPGTLTADALVIGHWEDPGNVKWAFFIWARLERGFWADAVLRRPFFIDASIAAAGPGPSFHVDSWLHRPVGVDMPGSFTWSATAAIHPVKSFSAKAWVAIIPLEDQQVWLYAYISGGRHFSADARIAVWLHPTGSFTISAEVSQTYRTSVVRADAVFRQEGWWAFFVWAFLKKPDPDPTIFGSGSFAVDARVGSRYVLDAYILRPPTFSLEAWLKSTSMLGYFHIWAVLAKHPPFVADAVIVGPADKYPIWMSAVLQPAGKFRVDAAFSRGFHLDASIQRNGESLTFTVGAFLLAHPVRWFPEPQPGDPPHRGPTGTFSQSAYTRRVNISIGNSDVTDNVLWAETSFTMKAKTDTGSFYLALRGSYGDGLLGSIVTVDVDDQRQFGGIAMRITRGQFQFDKIDDEPRTVIEGPDFNYILDRLLILNPKGVVTISGDDKYYVPIEGYPVGVTDADVINDVFSQYLPGKPEWFNRGFIGGGKVLSDKVGYKLGDPLQTLRSLLTDLMRLSDTIFWVDPYGRLFYGEKSTFSSGMGLSKGGGAGVGVQNLSVTQDIATGVGTAFVWGDIAEPEVGKEPDPGRIFGMKSGPTGDVPIWMQAAEVDGATIHVEDEVIKRATSLTDRHSKAVTTASARTTEMGYMAGASISVEGARGDLVIKSVTMGFFVGGKHQAVVYWDLECGMRPEDPWTFYDALPFARSETVDAHPSSAIKPAYEVATPYWWGQPSFFAMACIIEGVNLPVNHHETWESGWSDYWDSPSRPLRAWYDVGAENVGLSFDLSIAKTWMDDGNAMLDSAMPELSMSTIRMRLAPAWEAGLWPTCQVWYVSVNEGRDFYVESYGCRIEWRGTHITLTSKTNGRSATIDIGAAPSPCFVRLFVGGDGPMFPTEGDGEDVRNVPEFCAANVWRVGESEPTKWMLVVTHPHPWLEPPHLIVDVPYLVEVYRVVDQDFTDARNEASLLGVWPNQTGGPVGFSGGVLEQGRGSVWLVRGNNDPYAMDITERPFRASANYAYYREGEYCWFTNFPAPIEYQAESRSVGQIGRGYKDNVTQFFDLWGPYRTYFGAVQKWQTAWNGIFDYWSGYGRVYDPYTRANDGWWIVWSPCLFGGFPGGGGFYGIGDDSGGWHYNNEHFPHRMWKDSTFITIPIPSKYVRGFRFVFEWGLRTHQDFSEILGVVEEKGCSYLMRFWVWETDDWDVDPSYVDDNGSITVPQGIHGDVFHEHYFPVSDGGTLMDYTVKLEAKKPKRFIRYGVSFVSDTAAQADVFGPRGGPLFGPPWVRAVVAPKDRSILMWWDATDPEKDDNGNEATPETTVVYGEPPKTTVEVTDEHGNKSTEVVIFSPDHGWVEETVKVRTGTFTDVNGKKSRKRYFRTTRGYYAGSVSAYANGKKLIGPGDVDTDIWNAKHPNSKVDFQYWPMSATMKNGGTLSYEGEPDDIYEPSIFILKNGMSVSAVTVHYLVIEFFQSRAQSQHRKSDSATRKVDRLKRGMTRGYS